MKVDYNTISYKWDYYRYPWRPNENDFFSILNNLNLGNDILILGSTKEFRFYFKDRKIDICDLSEEMFKNLSVGNTNERLIKNDWFELKNNNYNTIIGDLVFLMLKKEKKINLLNILLENVLSEGQIILRILVKNNIDFKLGIKEVLENAPLFGKDSIDFFNYITFELVNGLGINQNKIFELISAYNQRLGEQYKNNFIDLTPYGKSKTYLIDETFLQKMFTEYNITIIFKKDFVLVSEYIIKVKK